MYNPICIVNEFIDRANKNGASLTHMQAQKLLYIAHGYSLAFLGEPLLEEPVCAWRYGPVIPSVYYALRHNRSNPIVQKAVSTSFEAKEVDSKTVALLDMIYETYGKLSGVDLSEYTHRSGTPWSQAMEKRENIIADTTIQDYYQRLAQRDPRCIGL
ncbi:Panacea domain-containing protein [Serratia marcescens]